MARAIAAPSYAKPEKSELRMSIRDSRGTAADAFRAEWYPCKNACPIFSRCRLACKLPWEKPRFSNVASIAGMPSSRFFHPDRNMASSAPLRIVRLHLFHVLLACCPGNSVAPLRQVWSADIACLCGPQPQHYLPMNNALPPDASPETSPGPSCRVRTPSFPQILPR